MALQQAVSKTDLLKRNLLFEMIFGWKKSFYSWKVYKKCSFICYMFLGQTCKQKQPQPTSFRSWSQMSFSCLNGLEVQSRILRTVSEWTDSWRKSTLLSITARQEAASYSPKICFCLSANGQRISSLLPGGFQKQTFLWNTWTCGKRKNTGKEKLFKGGNCSFCGQQVIIS